MYILIEEISSTFYSEFGISNSMTIEASDTKTIPNMNIIKNETKKAFDKLILISMMISAVIRLTVLSNNKQDGKSQCQKVRECKIRQPTLFWRHISFKDKKTMTPYNQRFQCQNDGIISSSHKTCTCHQ